MSHFTVMIIGDDPEVQLHPYSEHIEVEPYTNGPVSDESKKIMVEHYEKEFPEHKGKSYDELYEKFGEQWNGNTCKKNKDGVWEEWSTYNPKSQWDWYTLGGRWSGDIIKLKKGATGESGEAGAFDNKVGIDAAKKGDIDFEGMKDDAEKVARKQYKKVMKCFNNSLPVLTHILSEILDPKNERYNVLSIDEKRTMYHEQDAIKEVNKHIETLGHFFDISDYQCNEDEYAERARDSACQTFAVLKDGVWYERGKMGWWACVSDEKDDNDWNNEIGDLLSDVPDDTLISIYDCHI